VNHNLIAFANFAFFKNIYVFFKYIYGSFYCSIRDHEIVTKAFLYMDPTTVSQKIEHT